MKKRNKYLLRIVSMFIFFILIFTNLKININASEKIFFQKNKLLYFSEEEIGKSDEKSVIYEGKRNDNGIIIFSNILPNSMTFDWVIYSKK